MSVNNVISSICLEGRGWVGEGGVGWCGAGLNYYCCTNRGAQTNYVDLALLYLGNYLTFEISAL